MPIIIDMRETRPEVLELARRIERGEAAARPLAARLRAGFLALTAAIRRVARLG